MEASKLREAANRAPLRKFTINLADGRRVAVEHRDFISISPEGRSCIVWDENDGMELIDVRLIQSVAVTPLHEADAA